MISLSSFTVFLALVATALSVVPVTDRTVPPLQWIKLDTQGIKPPKLRGSVLAYDKGTGVLMLFGGETEAGLPYGGTHLLNTVNMTWSTPTPPANFQATPKARSFAAQGNDYYSNYRQDQIIFGGLGQNGELFNDVWLYNFAEQFWFQVNTTGAPSPRYNAVGGSDPLLQTNPTPVDPTVFYVTGGTGGSQSFKDTWKLSLTGAFTAGSPTANGGWEKVTIPDTPSKVGQAGAVLGGGSSLTMFGGCPLTPGGRYNATCAKSDASFITLSDQTPQWTSFEGCPSGRYGAVLGPNLNTFRTAVFKSQVFMFLGLTDKDLWSGDDGEGGEVSILDVSIGKWARIIPSCDPGPPEKTGPPVCPTAREGSAVFSFPLQMVGGGTSRASDTLVYGGRDAAGAYLDELWLLRAYDGVIEGSSAGNWSGFGDGRLQSGPTASGTGVQIKYLTECAQVIQPNPTPTPTSSNPSQPQQTGDDASAISFEYDASSGHKILSAISIALVLPAIIVVRISSTASSSTAPLTQRSGPVYVAGFTGLAAYALGVAGFALAFTSTYRPGAISLAKRALDPDSLLKTPHGKAGVAMFILLYGAAPFLFFLGLNGRGKPAEDKNEALKQSFDAGRREKTNSQDGLVPVGRDRDERVPTPSTEESSPQSTSRPPSAFFGGFLHRHRRRSSGSQPETPSRGFEVINRGQGFVHASDDGTQRSRGSSSYPRTLNEISWLERRRNPHATSELDYALSQMQPSPEITPPLPTGTSATYGDPSTMRFPPSTPLPALPPQPPTTLQAIAHVSFQLIIFSICIFTLVSLWERAAIGFFIAFLLWCLAFYAGMVFLGWTARPHQSLLVVTISRLRGEPVTTIPSPPQQPQTSSAIDQLPPRPSTAASRSGPYTHHQPLYRRVLSEDRTSPVPREVEADDDDDEDDAERQWRMEQEMERREVSIITVPKRRLVITNAA